MTDTQSPRLAARGHLPFFERYFSRYCGRIAFVVESARFEADISPRGLWCPSPMRGSTPPGYGLGTMDNPDVGVAARALVARLAEPRTRALADAAQMASW